MSACAAFFQSGNADAPPVPVELFREVAFAAIWRRDMALLGRTLSLASQCGYPMHTILGSAGNVGNLLALTNDVTVLTILNLVMPRPKISL